MFLLSVFVRIKLVKCTEVRDIDLIVFNENYLLQRSAVYCCTGYLSKWCICWINLVKIGCENFSCDQLALLIDYSVKSVV